MRKVLKNVGILVMALGIFFGMSLMSFAANGDIAGGVIDESYGQITWRIDKNGHLTVEGWGDVSDQESMTRVPWHSYSNKIFSAKVTVERMKDASFLFYECKNIKNIDLTDFATNDVTNMRGMFYGCHQLKSVDVSKFDTGNVTDMRFMFYECKTLEVLDVSKFDTGNVADMGEMFSWCYKLKILDVSKFDTSKVKDMGTMFHACNSLKHLDVSKFDTGNVTNMGGMFAGCESLDELDVSGLETSKVRYMGTMFADCKSIKFLDVSEFKTENVTYMDGMFANCKSLIKLDVSNFDTNKLQNTYCMFMGCEKLESLDMSKWNFDKITYAERMLSGCWNLSRIETPLGLQLTVYLPTQYEAQIWYRPTGEKNKELPKYATESITLVRLESAGFQDVFEKSWYAKYVQYVANKGLMNGYQGMFTPEAPTTRAMVIQTLYNMKGKPEVTDYKACDELKDVYQDWYTDAVCWAYNEGITTGYDDSKTFKVNEPVTREQLATFFYRYAELQGYDRSQNGTLKGLGNADKVSFYAEDAVHWAVGAELIKGIEVYESGWMVGLDLAPQGTATRAQMAAILQRFCEAYKIKEGIMVPGEASYIPIGAYEWNGQYYAVFDNCLNWEVAKAYCESRGGHLAVIDSAEENEALYAYIKEQGYTSAYFGLSDTAEEGTWSWVNGETTDYTNWNADEPGGGTDENYAMFFYLYEDGTWNDGAFKENVYDGGNAYICEWE